MIQIVENLDLGIEKKECSELRLRIGCVINLREVTDLQQEKLEPPTEINPSTVTNTEIRQEEGTSEQEDSGKIVSAYPPFPKRLVIPKPIFYLDFDLLGEIKNICIKIPLL